MSMNERDKYMSVVFVRYCIDLGFIGAYNLLDYALSEEDNLFSVDLEAIEKLATKI